MSTAASPLTSATVGETPAETYQRLYGTPASPADATTSGTPAQATPATVVATVPPELLQTLQSIQQELATLKTSSSPASQSAKLEWVDKIRAGDFEGAQTSLAESVQRSLQPRFDAVRQQAYQDALNAGQIQSEMDRHLQNVRSANPDFVNFERYLQAPVVERINLAQAAGRVRTPADFLKEYRSAVDAEVATLRNLGLQFRAAGKDEANTRSREVVSASPLTPQQVASPTTSSQVTSQADQGESMDGYFARRRADEARRKGLE